MFGARLVFSWDEEFLLKNTLIIQIFRNKRRLPKRVAKVGFFYGRKKSLTGKYLLNLGQAQAMFGKCAPETHFSEFYFCPA